MGYIAETRVTANLIAQTGQSNAMGFYPDVELPADYQGEQKDIFINFPDYTLTAFRRMNPATNCGTNLLTAEVDAGGWSTEQSVTHDLLASTGLDVAIVKTGENGGHIGLWAAGQDAYTELENGLKAALNHTDPQMYFYNWTNLSLLWFQGESDAILGTGTVVYEAALRDVISRIRASHASLTNLPIVMVKLPAIMVGSGEYAITETHRNEINAAYANIVADTANTAIIDTDVIVGLAMRDDDLHYTGASLLLIGSAWHDLM